MNRLKHLVIHSPAIRAIDYASDREVVLAVDSSWIAVGFILLQLGKDNKRYPSRFGSITWNEREQRYSQAKIELYGLFRALRAVRLYIVGVRNFVVEVDAKYIKGMINNPDIQPNAAMNRWIAGILLFDFTLRHVPGKDHAPADGLSRRPAAPEDPMEDDDPDDWIDNAYGFSIALINWEHSPTIRTHACPSTEYYLPDTHSTRPSTFRISVLVSAILPDKMEIPRSHKAVTQDEFLQRIQAFLTDPIRPPDMSELNFRRFVNYAGKFFIHADTLWRRDSHNRHKVVLRPDRRLHLLTTRAIMLQMRPAELTRIRADLLKSRHAHVRQYIRDHARSFRDFDFPRGALVLVRNSTIESSNDRKSKPRYFGPMIVIRRLPTGSYALAEIDGTLSKLRFAAFRVVPYHPRSTSHISVTTILDLPSTEIEAITHEPPPTEYDPWEDPEEL
ncbi:hypothetical protein Hypma_005803 [Hypsizygus marmoreus]|uniref:Reverse transcriptase RNase H-like domain-containing protein n=1 Tax=Hypsizygus marmoreus TaxID=39966 RepID=A0A369KGE2_HYPMA|nr:hypothetical protein Hypma_005803 [Hypsizygus marmoreus]